LIQARIITKFILKGKECSGEPLKSPLRGRWKSGISSVPFAAISGELIDYSDPSATTKIRNLSIIFAERERKPIEWISATTVIGILKPSITETCKNPTQF